ncbi:hypothetical protein G9C85_14100 [Halorubellus sp. JP-L1]|uniref:DUF7576 family protein n=1 Tax=Halorubellus sp. JP-L1 TaxID=2715753 RepID=UPI00140D9A7C|nr:hypothetical protein [Halorubellus sp. JP-L1]NHN42754.1 hypothetical protein [Halorubellus sp. JP-L1]
MTEREIDSDRRHRPDDGLVDTERCASCGREIDPSDWHPVATQYTSDDEFQILAFCGPECREDWTEE